MRGLLINVGSGPHLAKKPWINTDLICDEAAGILPDVIAPLQAMPFDDGSVSRLYAGHCLEHIPIVPRADLVVGYVTSQFALAMAEVRRVLAPDGVACFVCPDVYKAIQWYREGRADWALVDACLEGPDDGIDPASAWDGCFHAFNCHEARLLALVAASFPDAQAVAMGSPELAEFPVVSHAGWQCAVVTR